MPKPSGLGTCASCSSAPSGTAVDIRAGEFHSALVVVRTISRAPYRTRGRPSSITARPKEFRGGLGPDDILAAPTAKRLDAVRAEQVGSIGRPSVTTWLLPPVDARDLRA